MNPANAVRRVLSEPWLGAIRSDLRRGGLNLMFVALVVLPVSIATVYYTLIASNVYVSEAKFIVRGVKGQTIGGLASFFRTLGIARAEDDAFAVQNFIRSRDAVRQLNSKFPLARMYSRPGVDPVASFGVFWTPSRFESLYQYYLSRVEVSNNDVTGITTLRVQAFTPEDASAIASSLLVISEQLVNRMNNRASRDALIQAKKVVSEAEEAVFEAQRKLTEFRNQEKFVDPANASLQVFEVISERTSELVAVRIQIGEIQKNSPLSPALETLRNRERALSEQIAAESSRIAGSDGSLVTKISAYERLVLQREFTDRALSLALDALESARQEARGKQLYIQTIVTPNTPDEALEPRRMRYILTIALLCVTLYGVVWLIYAGAKEHAHA
jgi:capsular polysaccharide transport system permease protein